MIRIGSMKLYEIDGEENNNMKLYKLERESKILVAWFSYSDNIVYYYNKRMLIESGWWRNKDWKSAISF